ncbi:hypothetical protein C3R44_23840, partial [Mycobacterium tuberculosis]
MAAAPPPPPFAALRALAAPLLPAAVAPSGGVAVLVPPAGLVRARLLAPPRARAGAPLITFRLRLPCRP